MRTNAKYFYYKLANGITGITAADSLKDAERKIYDTYPHDLITYLKNARNL